MNIFLEQHLILIHKTLMLELVLCFILSHVEICMLHLSWGLWIPILIYLCTKPNSSSVGLQRYYFRLSLEPYTLLQWLSLNWLKETALVFDSTRSQLIRAFSVVLVIVNQMTNRYSNQLPLKLIKLLYFRKKKIIKKQDQLQLFKLNFLLNSHLHLCCLLQPLSTALPSLERTLIS